MRASRSVVLRGFVVGGVLLVASSASGQQVFVYPQKGQSPQQQAQDTAECQSWATQQTGGPAAAPQMAAAPPPTTTVGTSVAATLLPTATATRSTTATLTATTLPPTATPLPTPTLTPILPTLPSTKATAAPAPTATVPPTVNASDASPDRPPARIARSRRCRHRGTSRSRPARGRSTT